MQPERRFRQKIPCAVGEGRMATGKRGTGDLLLGVDLGTGGVRGMAVDLSGEVVASSTISLDGATVMDEGESTNSLRRSGGRHPAGLCGS